MLPALMVTPTTRTLGLLVGLRGGPGHASQTATRQANCIHCGRDRSRVTPGRDGGRRAPHSMIATVTSGSSRAPTRVLLIALTAHKLVVRWGGVTEWRYWQR